VWRFTYDRAGLQRAFNHALPPIRALYRDLGFNVSDSRLLPFIQYSFPVSSRWLTYLAIGLAVYALIELAESAGPACGVETGATEPERTLSRFGGQSGSSGACRPWRAGLTGIVAAI
jgi:hypothetical protein